MYTGDLRPMLKKWIQDRASQEKIAEKANMSPAQLSRILSGKRSASTDSLDRIMAAAGVDLLTLVSEYGERMTDWISVPILPIGGMPAMNTTFDGFVAECATQTLERISIPLERDDGPAIAMRLSKPILHFNAGDIIILTSPINLEPGKIVAVQINDRTELGVWQQRGNFVQIAVDNRPFRKEDCVLIGKAAGVWRNL